MVGDTEILYGFLVVRKGRRLWGGDRWEQWHRGLRAAGRVLRGAKLWLPDTERAAMTK